MFNLSLKTNTRLQPFWVYALYGNRTHVNSLDVCYPTTTPTIDAEKVYDRRPEFQNLQTWIFSYKYSECHIKKKTKTILWEAE